MPPRACGPIARHRRVGKALLMIVGYSPGWARGGETSEILTSGCSLVDLRTAYVWRTLRLDFAITNLLDRRYTSPLGGTWQSAQYPPGYGGATFRPLPAAGRSLDTGFSVNF